jgi:glycosyltransferase involved in cell wall biosynthesis
MTPISSEPRILIFCHSHYGPFADVVRQYAVLFKESSFKVTSVYLTGEPSEFVREISASDEVIFLNFKSEEIYGLKLKAILRLREIVSQRNFQFCIAHRFKPIYIALLATTLPVIGVHHAFGDYERWSHRFFVNRFRKRLSLLGISNSIRDDIRKDLFDWPQDQLLTFYNHIDPDRVASEVLPKDQAREMLNLPHDGYIIGNVGRLHPDKDQATLIKGFAEALPELPQNACLVILGEGRLETNLRQLTKTLGIETRVCFLGQIPNARRLFSAFDLFVLSSDHEPFGMVLLEAMAARTPIVVSDCGGAPEVVSDYQAHFALGDHHSLSRRLVAWSNKPAQELKATVEKGFDELRTRFSDDVAQRAFFNLPPIQRLMQVDQFA